MIPVSRITALYFLFVVISVLSDSLSAQEIVQVEIFRAEEKTKLNPNLYGQFIEYLGNSITGGIYDEGSELSDTNGFRRDVLEKMNDLEVPVLRYPGGTVTKIYHWEDGIGPKENRPARRNLIWGGVENNHFGTDEYIQYCREIDAEPYIVVNMGSGTAEEAANWVEYCNGTGDTYYANLRRKYGQEKPYNVKYWSLGNEEAAEPDAGRLYDPKDYAKESWYFAKLMKLTDPTIKLFVVADPFKYEWNDVVLESLAPITDYVSLHWYVGTNPGEPYSIYSYVSQFDSSLTKLGNYLSNFPDTVKDFPKWYRFPPRENPIKISVDEWGIWEGSCGGKYNLDCEYTWRHALATASFLNVFHRQAKYVTMANWAQSVNVLGAILANKQGAVEQTVFYPLKYYRKFLGDEKLEFKVSNNPVISDQQNIASLDVSATFNSSTNEISVFVVNRSKETIPLEMHSWETTERSAKMIELTAPNVEAKNVVGKKSVIKVKEKAVDIDRLIEIAPVSISILVLNQTN